MTELVVCVDVGGTFVDLALFSGPRLLGVHKVLNTPARPEEAVMRGVGEILDGAGCGYGDLAALVYSTTLAINAVIERRGARTALLCTSGFRDALEVRNEQPYDLYNPFAAFPEPLVRRSLRLGVRERTLADGTIEAHPDRADLVLLADDLAERGVASVAVCLLHSYANPANERAVGALLAERLPGVSVSLSSEVLPEIGEYGRTSTTVTNAYLLDVVGRHLDRLRASVSARGFTGRLLAVTSAGGLIDQATASSFPVKLLESGPAAGSVGISAAIPGDLVTFDMGGTTAKTSFIAARQPHRTSDYEVGRIERFRRGSGLLVRVPTIDIVEIGAGGGSIARLDRSGVLVVGPESAGADPGPACYGRGGEEPTVTDADLLLGYLNPDYFLGGAMRLDPEAGRTAISRHVAAPLGIDETEAALAIYRVVNAQMAQALGVHAAERGINLRRLQMVAFGGAGPVHAFAVAEEVGVETVIVPPSAGVLSAIGCRSVPGAFETVATYKCALADLDLERLNQLVTDLRERAAVHARGGNAWGEVRYEHEVDVEYAGQRSVVVVPFAAGPRLDTGTIDAIEAGFENAYRERYGRTVPGVRAEAVTWRVRAAAGDSEAATVSWAATGPAAGPARAAVRTREVVFAGEGRLASQVYPRAALRPGQAISGPAIIEDEATTIVVPPRARCLVGDDLSLRLDLRSRLRMHGSRSEGAAEGPAPTDAATLSIYWGKLVSITEEAATALARTAFSRVVTEARDYSCVLCDAEGELIAQPLQGLPEFVNSLAEAVRHFLRAHPAETLREGDVLISNDPLLCTSQMNDFVLVQPIWHHGRIVGYAANVSHSPDVGGRLLSAEAREVFEEGLRVPVCKLFERGEPNTLLLSILRANTRVPEIMIGDLMAQAAANRVSERLLVEFLEREGLPDIDDLAREIRSRSDRAVRDALRKLPAGRYTGSVTMDGLVDPLTIRCRIDVEHEPPRATVDFDGTSPQTDGSLNCYLNYITAEAIFALLTVLQPGTPVNGGSLRPFTVTAPLGCVVNARPPAAVGARSLVVQFVVSAVYNALSDTVPDRVLAEPAAPVWPVLVSGEKPNRERFVEMILLNGGLGARPNADGVLLGFPAPVVSSKVEVLESEVPFVVEHAELIDGSGGDGRFRGGPGQTFVLRCVSSSPVYVLLRTERLRHPAKGIRGGGAGRPGQVVLNGKSLRGKETFHMSHGDVLRLETPGGGGYGPPEEREAELLARDREDGLVENVSRWRPRNGHGTPARVAR